jgi:mannose-6-phosphate isomerase-like protein (cupin superfamily)
MDSAMEQNRTKRNALADTPAYTTKDGSTIRELMHPALHGNRNQSLAEATVPVGGKTAAHRHGRTEEIYFFTAGCGRMRLGTERFAVAAGDVVCIDTGVVHALENSGDEPLRLLCCCAPPYSHDDTELVD